MDPANEAEQDCLKALGVRIRQLRKQQKVSAVSAAEAAGMSRITWHRIERGEPGVSIGAWAAAARVIGLKLDLRSSVTESMAPPFPEQVHLDNYPQLKSLTWNLPGVRTVSPRQAFELYERNWRHVDRSALGPSEQALIEALGSQFGREFLRV